MARKTKSQPQGSMRLYSSYMFRDKDPAIDEIRTVMQRHYRKNNLDKEDYNDVAEQGGPTAGCIKAWFEGKTKRPQNATLEAAGRALGFERVWQQMPQSRRAGDGNGKKK